MFMKFSIRIILQESPVHPVIKHSPDPIGIDSENTGCFVDWHLVLNQHHGKGFEQQRESAAFSGKG